MLLLLSVLAAVLPVEAVRQLPPLSDLARFPSEPYCQTMVLFNRAWLAQFRVQQVLHPEQADWTAEACWQADHCADIWGQVCMAQHGIIPSRMMSRGKRPDVWVKYWTVQRAALGRLREVMGEEAYLSGVMPPPVPLWALRRLGN